jgi:hypothetical protein
VVVAGPGHLRVNVEILSLDSKYWIPRDFSFTWLNHGRDLTMHGRI